jgi:DNA-binding CsgD family transcriptional regulator
MFEKESLLHYGVKRRSGRYPWGSGEDAYQRSQDFLREYTALKSKGLGSTQIAKEMGMNTTQLRNAITWNRNEQYIHNTARVHSLKAEGMSNVQIGKTMGISEATVRNYLSKKTQAERNNKIQFDNVTDAIKGGVDKTGYLDVGVGVERQLGVSRTKFNAAVNKLVEDEGYNIHEVYVKRLSAPETATSKAKYTTVKVLSKESDIEKVKQDSNKIRPLDTWSEDKARSLNKHYSPHMLDLKRIKVRYDEEGGRDKDGLIELRPGVKDLDLGKSKYAQVRIGAGDNLYLKGMAAYSDDKFPDGVDIIFNTNKSKDTPVEKVLKEMKMDSEKAGGDPSFMFGSSVIRQKGALNIVNEEGDWDTWSTRMSSQFLSKQPTNLIKDRLDDTYSGIQKEFDEISSLTNPVVKKFLLDSESTGFINSLNSKAKHLKAKGLPKTKSHVLLPFPNMNANEIYAPNYKDGERVVLVRHPHGGIFEIPDLVVNNKNATAKKMLGNAPDAVGIHPSVAQKLSGADFDGDTALVIPNPRGQIKTARSLKELANFDHIAQYKVDKDSPVNLHRVDKNTGELINTGKTILDKTKQLQMGVVSNLITDMTIRGASQAEIARAVKHSMVVIDAEKHNLDYKQSARDNGIAALIKKWQSRTDPETGQALRPGASTLISRSKRRVNIDDPDFDPDKLTSGTAKEELYADYIRSVQKTKNEAVKISQSIAYPKYSKEAAKKYSNEVKSLNVKLNKALLNAPKERQAQILTNQLYFQNVQKGMDKDAIKKLKARSLATARETVGAKKSDVLIEIDDKEWEAIQSSALSPTKLIEILKNADMDIVRKHATPREAKLSTTRTTRAQTMLSKGYTYAEVAEALGVSTKTLREELKIDDDE